jgi:hypothetical protein
VTAATLAAAELLRPSPNMPQSDDDHQTRVTSQSAMFAYLSNPYTVPPGLVSIQ